MRVSELATDLKVSAETLLTLLRKMGIALHDEDETVSDAHISRVLARIERERRAGHKGNVEAIDAALEEARSSSRRRRRRRKADIVEEEPPAVEASDEDAADESSPLETTDEAAGPPAGESPDGPESPEDDAAGANIDDVPASVAADADEPEEAVSEEPAAVESVVEEPVVEQAAEGDDLEESPAVEEASGDFEVPAEPDGPLAPKPQPARAGAPDTPVRVIRKKPKPSPAASAGPGGQVRIQAEGYTPDGQRKLNKKKGKKRQRVDQGAVQLNIQRVMAELKGGGRKRRRGRGSRPTAEEREAAEVEAQEEREREAATVRVNEFLTVAELADLIDVPSTEIIGSAFKNLGLMVTINQRLDFDQIELLLEEFNFTAVREQEYGAEEQEEEEEDRPEDLVPRPPVVTVMGHVDHGKTKLLDSIRNTNVVAGEAGGITQHIGAYHVEVEAGRTITFLDTPGHAAFTAMRARGADITDIVILMVAADDSVMPQTIEAISHARNAGVPLVVAINKIDLPAANPDKVKQELLQHEVTVEDFGGEVISATISAKAGTGIVELLEKILLQAELLELTANPDRDAFGTVIEAKLDVGKGPVVSVLVQKGTLRVGDNFICGQYDGRVRAMLDERGKPVEEAGPSVPVQILGASGVPQAGDTIQAMDAVRAAEIASTRQRLEREKQLRIKERGFKLGDFSQLLAQGEVSTLPLIIKGDVDGSVQAVSDTLERLSTHEVRVEIIHRAVGAINEEDVLLAETAGGVIIGFRVRPNTNARQLAERDGVDIHVYDVIYNAENDIRAALEGMLSPEQREKVVGSAEVRETFKVTKVGTVAGCYVTDGVIDRNATARLIREGIVVYTSDIGSLKRFKDDVKEVREGFECGIGIANFNDVKVGDVIECFVVEEFARTLAGSAQGQR